MEKWRILFQFGVTWLARVQMLRGVGNQYHYYLVDEEEIVVESSRISYLPLPYLMYAMARIFEIGRHLESSGKSRRTSRLCSFHEEMTKVRFSLIQVTIQTAVTYHILHAAICQNMTSHYVLHLHTPA